MTILIGYVPTAVGEAALQHGLTEAARAGDDVVILNSPRRGATVDTDQIDEYAAAELVARSAAAGVSARVETAEHGADIVEAFEEVVRATGARMVVIGLRRRSPVGKLVLGSAAQRILLESSVPVLAVKPAG
jgi:nucleotide-binding universal stress UspA family protein